MPPRASGFLRIRCWTRPCLGSWIFAYTVYATKQKPARVPEFCVYATEQKPPQVPGFLRTQLGRGLPGLLDFCVYCIRCKTETCSSSWIFAYTLQNRSLLEFLDFCVYSWAGPCLSFWIFAYTLPNTDLLMTPTNSKHLSNRF